MAALTGNAINTSYEGILKTLDNAAIGGTAKGITDGAGNAINMEILTGQINFPSGTVDFTGATVIGAGGAAGLASGTGTNSMESQVGATDGNAQGDSSIAIGQGATISATAGNSIAIGTDTASNGGFSNALGVYTEAGGNYATAIGSLCNASASNSLAIGKQASATNQQSISIGTEAACSNANGIAIGYLAEASAPFGSGSVAIGWNVATYRDAGIALGRTLNQAIGTSDHYRPITIGSGGNTRGGDCIGIGTNINILGTGTHNKIAIGTGAVCNDVTEAVALGAGVTATKASTVSVKELETVVAGGGITMKSPNGTEYKLTVSDAGVLVIT